MPKMVNDIYLHYIKPFKKMGQRASIASPFFNIFYAKIFRINLGHWTSAPTSFKMQIYSE